MAQENLNALTFSQMGRHILHLTEFQIYHLVKFLLWREINFVLPN